MSDIINLVEFPQYLADTLLGGNLFAGQILATVLFMSLILSCFAVLTKGKNIPILIIMGIISEGFCVAIGWSPYWFLLITCMVIALMFAGEMRDMITGRSR